MSVKFNSAQVIRDFESVAKRKRISIHRAAVRVDIEPSTIYGLRSGAIKDVTVTTLARMLDFMGETDVGKYIYEDNTPINKENG
jgi:hypothetical protein